MNSNVNYNTSVETPLMPENSSIFTMGYGEEDFVFNASMEETTNLSEGSYGLQKNDSVLEPEQTLEFIGFGIPNTVLANRIVHYCFGILLTFIGIAGATGNGLVIYVFARYRRLRGGGVPLILSLAAGDFSVSILHIMPAYSSFREIWSFGDLGCEIYAASVGLCGLASLLTLSVIAAERFSVIMGSPVRWLSSKTACALIWIFSLGLVFPPFFGWSKYVTEGIGTSCSWDYTSRDFRNRTYYICLLALGFVVPVAIIIVSYLGILYVVCKQSALTDRFSRSGGLSKKNPTRSDLKTAQVVLSIITCFLISWTPYAICSMIGQFGDASLLSPLATALPALFAKASVIYNPFVYSLSHPLFRTAFAALKAQYMGKRNSSGFSLNPRSPHHHHLRPHHHNRHGGTRKTQLVVTAKGNGTYSSCPYNRNGYHLDGQKIQFDGFKGKIPTHLLRHFTGNNNPDNGTNSKSGRCDKDVDAMVHPLAQRAKDTDIEQGATFTSCSPTTTPSTSFRCKQNVKYLKKGAWIFKQANGPPSESDVTARTAVATHYGSSSSASGSDGVDTQDGSINRYKSILKRANGKGEGRFMKNSYTFFLCEFRKRRQKNIQETFFRSENCLTNTSFNKKFDTCSSKPNTFDAGFGTQQETVEVLDKISLTNDYCDEVQLKLSKDKKLDEVENQITTSLLCVKRNNADDSNENDDLGTSSIDTSRGQQNCLAGRQSECHKNGNTVFFHKENEDERKCIPACNCNKESCFSHNDDKHLNFIKEGKRDEWATTTIFLSNKCPKVKQGNSSFQMDTEEKEGITGEISPNNISLGPSFTSCENVDEKVHEIVTGKSNTNIEELRAVRKSISLSGLTTCATESIFPALVRIPMKTERTGLIASSDCNLHNCNRNSKREARMIRKAHLCEASDATSESIVPSSRACKIDSGGRSSWYRASPNATSLSSHELYFKEDDIASQCNSESCYASCKSDLNLEDFEMNSVEGYCLYHCRSCEICNS